jgi:hypothetical protein
MFMPMRSSSRFCSSSGSDRFSTVNASSASPSASNAGRSPAAMVSASVTVFAAMSRKGTCDSANACDMRVTTRLRSCGSTSGTR